MTPARRRLLLQLIEAREAQDALERASGWIVEVTHADALGGVLGRYGPFQEPAAALAWAQQHEDGLNELGEEGFRCQVHPIMPTPA